MSIEMQPPETVEHLTLKDLSPHVLRIGAELIFSALPQFYEIFPVSKDVILATIGEQIGRGGTEMEECYVLRCGDQVRAMLAAVCADRWLSAKKGGLFGLLRNIPRDRMREVLGLLAEFETKVAPVPVDGLYLSRLGTAADKDAVGAGARLLRNVLKQSPQDRFSLHVHRANPARWLYGKLGFVASPHDQFEFGCMVLQRPSSSRSALSI